MSKLQMFARLTKIDEATRKVYGVIASESVDRSKEVFDYDASKPNFEQWSGDISKATDGKSLGNVRVMHGNVVAGRATQLDYDDVAKSISIEADIVDDAEWNKVQKGLYTGFSIGGKYVRKWEADGVKRYEAMPHEVSLVDVPCNRDATFAVMKGEGIEEVQAFDASVQADEGVEPVVSGDVIESEAGVEAPAEDANKGVTTEPVESFTEGALREVDGKIEKYLTGAWTAYGELAKAAAPAEEDEEELRKGAYSIASLARLAEDCRYLADARAYESWDGETRPVKIPPAMKAAAIALYDALVECVDQDATKAKAMLAEKSVEAGDLRKQFDARIEIATSVDDLCKAVGVEDVAALAKGISEIAERNTALVTDNVRLKKLYDESPAPMKGALKVIAKSADVDDGEGDTATASGEKTPEALTKAAFAASFANPIVVGPHA